MPLVDKRELHRSFPDEVVACEPVPRIHLELDVGRIEFLPRARKGATSKHCLCCARAVLQRTSHTYKALALKYAGV